MWKDLVIASQRGIVAGENGIAGGGNGNDLFYSPGREKLNIFVWGVGQKKIVSPLFCGVSPTAKNIQDSEGNGRGC